MRDLTGRLTLEVVHRAYAVSQPAPAPRGQDSGCALRSGRNFALVRASGPAVRQASLRIRSAGSGQTHRKRRGRHKPARHIWIQRVIVTFLGAGFWRPAFSAGAPQPADVAHAQDCHALGGRCLAGVRPLACFGRVKRRPRFGNRSTMESIRPVALELELVVRAGSGCRAMQSKSGR